MPIEQSVVTLATDRQPALIQNSYVYNKNTSLTALAYLSPPLALGWVLGRRTELATRKKTMVGSQL